VVIRIILLRRFGSNNPNGTASALDKSFFHPYYTIKDIYGAAVYLLILSFFVFFMPDSLGHPDNYIKANSLVTPASIVPEFYLLFAYAILKSIPNKLGGILGLVASISILFFTPLSHTAKIRSNRFKPLSRKLFWFFICNFFLLTYLGALHAEEPYVIITQISTFFYFGYFLWFLPIVGFIENKTILSKCF
jgi:ubiquinol-cytochrome c reductase cytochrome b subunit